LEGVILQNRPGGPPLPGVVVSAPGAKQSFTTTNSGRFLLEFPKKHPGDAVLLTCAREGMEVVNDMALEVRLGPKHAEAPVRLYMCKQGERSVHAAKYYRIEIRRVIDGNYQNEVERIKNVHQKDIDRKNAEIARLHQEREKVFALSDEWAKKFAAVRRDTASELYKEAYRLFQAGDIDRAIAVLDDAKLEEARRIAKSELEKSVETHMLKARLLIMKFRFGEAQKYFR
ncbi:MAG: hypothetical protein GY859_36935, partial [Desulfobacterales bacterium]|nr:hypothetical protein [Desulfobacterales bacterium]